MVNPNVSNQIYKKFSLQMNNNINPIPFRNLCEYIVQTKKYVINSCIAMSLFTYKKNINQSKFILKYFRKEENLSFKIINITEEVFKEFNNYKFINDVKNLRYEISNTFYSFQGNEEIEPKNIFLSLFQTLNNDFKKGIIWQNAIFSGYKFAK